MVVGMQPMPRTNVVRDYRDLEKTAIELLALKGYSILPPDGLVSSAFHDTFAPSAFHARIVESVRLGPKSDESIHQAGCEWAYRHVDQEKVGPNAFHLSSFRMLVFFAVYPSSGDHAQLRQQTVRTFVDALRVAGLDPRHCLVTYFGGGNVLGQSLSPDEDIAQAWVKVGIPEENLIPVCGSSNFTNINRSGEPVGPRCEIFWKAENDQTVELGTVVFEQGLLNDETRFATGKGFVYGGALGIERLAMASGAMTSIFLVPELDNLRRLVHKSIDPRLALVCASEVCQFVDAVRTLAVLVAEVGLPDRSRRGDRMHKLVRKARRCLLSLGLDRSTSLVGELVTAVAQRELMVENDLACARIVGLVEGLISKVA